MATDRGGVFLDAILSDASLASPTDDYVIVGEWADDGGERAQILFRGSSDEIAAELRRGVKSNPHFDKVYTVSVEHFCEAAEHIN
jgi:hypothetical protein